MGLPQITVPEFTTVVPSTKQEILFRPFLVKEQKILLIAQEGNSEDEIFRAISKIVADCILTPGVDVSSLATFDLEYLFLQLRMKSIGEVVDLKLKHVPDPDNPDQPPACDEVTDVALNLEDINVVVNPEHTNPIMVTDTVGVTMKYPNFKMLQQVRNKQQTDVESTFSMISSCIENVFDESTVYDDFTESDIQQWVEQLNEEQFGKINQFFATLPELKHTITYECSKCGQQEEVQLVGLQSFFT